MRNILRTLVAVPVASVFVASNAGQIAQSPVALAATIANELPNTITDVARGASGAKASRPGRHLGFDTYAYPGDEIMRAWRHEDVPFEWVGYYLEAPCHEDDTWTGTRARLSDMGWGMAVIYVGQQTWDRTPTGYETHYKSVRRTTYVSKRVKVYRTVNGKRVARYVTKKVPVKRTVRVPVKVKVDPLRRDIHDCNAQLVGATRGRMEAADAIKRTAAEGFPRGTVIFLDVEYMRSVPERMRGYYKAWTEAVLADGRFVPGVYAHTKNAATIFRDVQGVFTKAGRWEEPPFWIAGPNKEFTPDKAPQDVGHAFADMWQGLLDVVQTHQGYRLPIDVNVAEVPDPSRRYVAGD